jgi:hypothetical protein
VSTCPVFAQPPYYTAHPPPLTINAEYEHAKQRQYLIRDTNVFFTQTQRITLVADTVGRTMIKGSEILDRGGTLLKDHHPNEVVNVMCSAHCLQMIGLSLLLRAGVFDAAYALHDADANDRVNTTKFPLRPWLRQTWARWGADGRVCV